MREERRWTQRDLAEYIAGTGHFSGFTHQRVEQLERADNASHRLICALCEVFQCKPAAFFVDD